jgi:cell wall-associated NlpC family hydrolase
MNNFYKNIYPIINLYRKMSTKSEIVTQMLYGDNFSILKKNSKWLKIKIREDNYKGFIRNKNFKPPVKSTHKIHNLKANIYKFSNNSKKIDELPFGSRIKITEKKYQFFKFDKGWVHQKDVRPVNYKEKNIFKNIKMFKNIKYKWGGKTFKGIDCSALIQVFINFNNKPCPRDAKDQAKYFKKNINLKNIKRNDIIYWKGHVAVALSKKKLIHAYGPMKRTVVTDIYKATQRIEKTANLKIIGIKRI